MDVVWSRHAKKRFFERALIYGLNEGEVENYILKQEIKIKQKNGTIKTIFCITNQCFTVIKEETDKWICVVSIWESNDKEVELWQKRK
jgi:hypothetical protein